MGEEGTEKDHRMLFSEKGTKEEKSTFRGQKIKDFVSQMDGSWRSNLEPKLYGQGGCMCCEQGQAQCG